MGYEITDIIYSCVVFAILALILLVGSKKEEMAVNARQKLVCLNNLRGIFALEIVIGHVIRYEKTLLSPLGKFMIISVAFFFFVSGFGMVQSFNTKVNYLNKFLFPKVGYLTVLALIIYVINVTLDYLIPYSLGYYNKGEFFSGLIPLTNWYIWEQIFFYFIFWIVYKYIKKYRVLCVFIITFVAMTLAYKFGWKQGFYSSSLAFPMGLLVGEYYEKCHEILRTAKGKILILIGVVLGLSSLLLGTESLIGMVYLRNMVCISGISLLLLLVDKISFDNKVLGFLGKYSVEIYLVQFIFLNWFKTMDIHYMMRIPLVIGCTIAGAVLLHPIFRGIRKVTRGC